jgi:hypothetical protein
MMFLSRIRWPQLIRGGVPPLFVLRPMPGGFTPPNAGDEYPAPDPNDKFQMARARQMYEQRRIGTRAELKLALAKIPKQEPVKHGKERRDGSQNRKNAR